MEEHEKKADEYEQQAEELDEKGDRVEDQIDKARSDLEGKLGDIQAPGLLDEEEAAPGGDTGDEGQDVEEGESN
jgi:uncharacterized coiled-coil DUF342 family protein